MRKKIGFMIGKFAPLHKGHQYLIETALKEMDEFYIVIYDTDLINISIEQRARWIKKLYPSCKIIYAYNSPKQYGLDETSVKIQIDYLKKQIKNIRVTHFYSSEEYGKYVARDIGVIDRRVDDSRKCFSVSATEIRENLEKNKKYLEDIVYNDLLKSSSICSLS